MFKECVSLFHKVKENVVWWLELGLTRVGKVKGPEERVVVLGSHSGVWRVKKNAVGPQQLLQLFLQLLLLLDDGGRGFENTVLLKQGQTWRCHTHTHTGANKSIKHIYTKKCIKWQKFILCITADAYFLYFISQCDYSYFTHKFVSKYLICQFFVVYYTLQYCMEPQSVQY